MENIPKCLVSSHHLQPESTIRTLARTDALRRTSSIYDTPCLKVNVPSHFSESSLQLATHAPPAGGNSAHHLPATCLRTGSIAANLRDSKNSVPRTSSQAWTQPHEGHFTSYTINALLCTMIQLIAHRLSRPHPSLCHLQCRSRHERARCHHTLAPDHVFVLFGAPIDRERDRLYYIEQ